MSNEQDKRFFKALCKQSGVKPADVKKLVWGKSIGTQMYWYGEESKSIKGNNIWCARAEAIDRGIQDKLLKVKKKR